MAEAPSGEVPSHGDGGHDGPSGGSPTAATGETRSGDDAGEHGATPAVTTTVLSTPVESGESGSGSRSGDGETTTSTTTTTTTTTTSGDSVDGGSGSGDSTGSIDTDDSGSH